MTDFDEGGGKFDRPEPQRDEDRADDSDFVRDNREGFDGSDEQAADEFAKIAEGQLETLREKSSRRLGDGLGMGVLGYVVTKYLSEKQESVSLAADMYEAGAPRLQTVLSLDDIEVQLAQAGLQVLTMVGDDRPEYQGLVKGLLLKIESAIKAANEGTTPEEHVQLNEAARKVQMQHVTDNLRALGKQLGLPDEEIEATIARAREDADAYLTQLADDDTGFTTGPLQ